MRVGGNVRLLRKLGYVRESAGIVYCWPNKAASKKQRPLVLRLMSFQLGRTQVHLVTNVLPPKSLSAATAKRLYEMRWGIELQFRTFKQTFGGSQLRSKTPDRAMGELHWSLLGLWMIQLFAIKEQIEIGAPPEKSSASQAIRVIRNMLMRWSETPDAGDDLQSQLRLAVIDPYQRSKKPKQARYRPFNKNKPAAGKPVITIATKKQKLRLKQCLNLAT